MDESALLGLHGLTKTYRRAGRDIAALSDFDLDLRPGVVLGLLGPNGAGKTS